MSGLKLELYVISFNRLSSECSAFLALLPVNRDSSITFFLSSSLYLMSPSLRRSELILNIVQQPQSELFSIDSSLRGGLLEHSLVNPLGWFEGEHHCRAVVQAALEPRVLPELPVAT